MKNSSFPLPKLLLVILGLAFIAGVVTALTGAYWYTGLAFVTFFGVAAVYFQLSVSWKTFAFTCWVFAFFLASLVVPEVFLVVGGFDQRTLIVPLIQVIMFGMGATLSLHDFSNALKMPKAVIIGMLLQFSVMPLVGWGIAYSFGFEPELAAGIILIGSCPG
ncbi:MAG: bile acid:sodium symporter family protein, partial [Verrucomicrobiae bacterium]|nr:bile acid:sodium symporter family protein [Verrucomicrobiae bacterium]